MRRSFVDILTSVLMATYFLGVIVVLSSGKHCEWTYGLWALVVAGSAGTVFFVWFIVNKDWVGVFLLSSIALAIIWSVFLNLFLK